MSEVKPGDRVRRGGQEFDVARVDPRFLGIDSMELVAVCSDLEAYPDEMLGQVAARIGFGPQFESVVDDDLT